MPAFKHSIGNSSVFGDTGVPGEITGLKELDKTLRDLPKGVRKKMIRNGMKEAAKPILDLAKSLVPVDQGKLRDKMKIYSARLGKKQKKVSVGATISWPKSKTSPGKYAASIEFGTNSTPAQPFLRPAVKGAGNDVKQKFTIIMSRLVDEAAKEAAAGGAK